MDNNNVVDYTYSIEFFSLGDDELEESMYRMKVGEFTKWTVEYELEENPKFNEFVIDVLRVPGGWIFYKKGCESGNFIPFK